MAVKATNQMTVIDLTDGYSVILTNESHTFIGGTNAVSGTQSTTTQIMALCGAEQVPCSVGQITTPNGLSAVSDGKSPSPTITITATSALTSGGSFDIPIVIGDITIVKKFSYAIAFTGAKGDKGNTGTSITIKSRTVDYQASSSGTTVPTGTWSTSIPSVSQGQYLWTRTTVSYSDGGSTVSYSVARQGSNGANGTSPTVKGTTVQYQQSTSGTTPPTGTWTTTPPAAVAGQYMWTKTTVTYSDGKTAVSYAVTRNGSNGAKGDKGDKGNTGATGPQGPTGPAGKDAILIQSSAPSSPKVGQLWQTASGEPIKRWDGSKWVLHYISVENLNVQKLSAIAADLGTVTAGAIKNKSGSVSFDVDAGVLKSWDNDTLQCVELSSGTVGVSAKDPLDNYVHTYLKHYGLFIHELNKVYGYSIEMSELGDDLIASKLINGGQGRENVSLFNNLKRTPVAGTRVVILSKGKNYVTLMTASEVASILGIENGTSDYVSISASNGDAKAFDARCYGAEYWSSDSSWYVYFNTVATTTQSVRINYILAPII